MGTPSSDWRDHNEAEFMTILEALRIYMLFFHCLLILENDLANYLFGFQWRRRPMEIPILS